MKPHNLGHNLLIAMDNTASSLEMVRTLAGALPDLAQTRFTLMHYLHPIYWEHGGVDTLKDEEILEHEEEWIEEEELEEEEETDTYFEQAAAILEDAGVPEKSIRTRMHFDEKNVSEAILNELQAGLYSGVIMGREHHDLLEGLLGGPVIDVLRKHAEDVAVWVIDTPENS